MDKVLCNVCSNKFSNKYMILDSGTYYCNCGYAINEKSYKGDAQIEN